MTLPRCIRAGVTWFVTRRITRRHFLLRPDLNGTLQSLYWYSTAVAAAEFGIVIHAVQMLSDHLHEVLTDTRGELPRFLQERNRLFANAIKVHRGWPEEVFSRKGANCVALYGASAVQEEIVYTLSNCVEAGLVHSPGEWRGVTTTIADMGKRVVRVKRPGIYFDPKNPRWPATAELSIGMPEALLQEMGNVTRIREVLTTALNDAVNIARRAVRQARRVVRGMRRVFRTPHTVRASAWEAFGARLPSFAAAGVRSEAQRALSDRRNFLSAYRRAFEALKRGVRNVLFPLGTWSLRVHAGVNCVPQ